LKTVTDYNLLFTLRPFVRLIVIVCITAASQAAEIPFEIPPTDGNLGATKIDFCQKENTVFAFNGLDLFRYNKQTNIFKTAFPFVDFATGETWDAADFAFVTDSNIALLPTGYSKVFVIADPLTQTAQKIPTLQRNYFSIASANRQDVIIANGVKIIDDNHQCLNTLYLIDAIAESETEIVQASYKYSGAIAFDHADNLYLADFGSPNDVTGLGNVDIYRISTQQISDFIADPNLIPNPQLIVNNAVLAGSDSIAIDANYNIYIASYVGIAKITPTPDANSFTVSSVSGNIYANPFAGWPMPDPVYSGITADIKNGTLYFGRSTVNQQYMYEPYQLLSTSIEAVTQWSADLNGNGIIDCRDLQIFSEQYNTTGNFLKADLDTNGTVNLADYVIFSNQWQNTAPWHRSDL